MNRQRGAFLETYYYNQLSKLKIIRDSFFGVWFLFSHTHVSNSLVNLQNLFYNLRKPNVYPLILSI